MIFVPIPGATPGEFDDLEARVAALEAIFTALIASGDGSLITVVGGEIGILSPDGDAGNALTITGTTPAIDWEPADSGSGWDYQVTAETNAIIFGTGFLSGDFVFTGTAGTLTTTTGAPYTASSVNYQASSIAKVTRTGTNPSIRSYSSISFDIPGSLHQFSCDNVSGTSGTIALGWWTTNATPIGGAVAGIGLVSSSSFVNTNWWVCYNDGRGSGLVQVADTGVPRDQGFTPRAAGYAQCVFFEVESDAGELRTLKMDGSIVGTYNVSGFIPRDGTTQTTQLMVSANGVTTPSINIDVSRCRGIVGGGFNP